MPALEVVGLFTTLDADTERVFHHESPASAVAAQAEALGLPLHAVHLRSGATAAAHAGAMRRALELLENDGTDAIIFGDIHLQWARARREAKLVGTGFEPIFPLWGEEPATLAQEIIDAGIQATIVSIDTRCVDRTCLGGAWNRAFIDALPARVDPGGEGGEYHTFVTSAPSFRRTVQCRVDTVLERPPYCAAIMTMDASTGQTLGYEEGVGWIEAWPLPTKQQLLEPVLTQLFREHWHEIVFGPLQQGAAWEVSPRSPPLSTTVFDGYLTVHFQEVHFHLCIGETRGDDYAPTPAHLAQHRRVARAELYRRINRDGTPDTWGLRLHNGAGEQQVTVLLPNPFLTSEQRFRAVPDWGRLALWDRLRRELLGLPSDPRDRSGIRMIYP